MDTLSSQAEVVASKRYYQKDDAGNIKEDFKQLVWRVSDALAETERKYGGTNANVTETAKQFAHIIGTRKFVPNSPALMNAGTGQGTLSACFVIPIEDTMEGIMKAATDTAMVQKYGGGTGFSLSKLRPVGSHISTTHGKACGPLRVLETLSQVSSMITQGGKRDGANMAVMDVHHPDILDFIGCKYVEGSIHNFNISVGASNKFMQAVKDDTEYDLIDPHKGKVVGQLNARDVFNKIRYGAWKNGEPGMIFLDTVNEDNHVLEEYGRMIATNPCGEQPLLGNESCNLGAVNLAKFVRIREPEDTTDWKTFVDWEGLSKTVGYSVRFLDNVIDSTDYATEEIELMTKATRKIGLGVMGFADFLIKLRVTYVSIEAREIGDTIMGHIREQADAESVILSSIRGEFPAWENSDYAEDEKYRNACRLTIAPTGTTSMFADCSSGIEPTFALVWNKQNILEGEQLFYTNDYFMADAKKYGFHSPELLSFLSEGRSIQDWDGELPEWVRDVYTTANEISPSGHVLMQSAFQKHVDSGISKTINFSYEATEKDIEDAYIQAWETGCKGITVYRNGSRFKEVLVTGGKTEDFVDIPTDDIKEDIRTARLSDMLGLPQVKEPISVAKALDNVPVAEYNDSECGCSSPMIVYEDGCKTCKSCGWSACSI